MVLLRTQNCEFGLPQNFSLAQSLKMLDRQLHTSKSSLRTSKSRYQELHRIPKADRFKWVAGLLPDILIVQLQYGNEINHSVYIDAGRKLIYDNAESHSYALTKINSKLSLEPGVSGGWDFAIR